MTVTPKPTVTPTVVPPAPPPPVPTATVPLLLRTRLTADASPEPVRRGRPVTVRGRLTRLSSNESAARYVAVAGARVVLQRRTLTGPYTSIRTVRTSDGGYLTTRLKALRGDRCYRWVYGGSPTTLAVASGRDCVHVRR